MTAEHVTGYRRDDVRAEDFARAGEMFALLGSPVRVQILWQLVERDYDVSTLAEQVGASVATVSHHLGRLRLAGLVQHRADGRRQVYSLVDPHLVQLVSDGVDHVADLRRQS